VASIRLAYIGGGSTRAPGTVASLLEQGSNFDGSTIVLVDLAREHLDIVKRIAEKIVAAKGLRISVEATTDQRAGLTDCDAVLTSFRPGGFEARHLDESIPLGHGLIGQETQGAGGFFMALRSVEVMKRILADVESVCPRATIFNYTNPINIVSQAVTTYSAVPIYSLCEGPIIFSNQLAQAADLDPARLDSLMIGLNHACWSVRHLYDGADVMPLVDDAYRRKQADADVDRHTLRVLRAAVLTGSIPPTEYFQYYYFGDEVLAELQSKPTTRAQDIMALVPSYWQHYVEESQADVPRLDPLRSRGGIFELELALDMMDAVFNDRKEVLPVNLPNRGAIEDLPDDLVVEVPAYTDAHGASPLTCGRLPQRVAGLIKMLGEYQVLAARAAWEGGRRDAILALASNPLVRSLSRAEALFDEMSAAHRSHLPARLLT
jgi:6-phospho-beta-glucosidase